MHGCCAVVFELEVYKLMKVKFNREYIVFLVISLIAAIIVGLRGNTNDTQDYYDVFRAINTLPILDPAKFYSETGMEVGFGWFAYIVKIFTSSSVVMFTLFSFINFYFIYKTTKLLDIYYPYSALLYLSSAYFFMQQFMQMRQGLAVSIVIFTVVWAIKNGFKFWQLLLLALSISLHQSSAILIAFCGFFYIFRNTQFFNARVHKIANWGFFLVFIVFFKLILLNLLISVSSRLQSYANSDTYNEAIGLFSLPNIRTFLILMVLTYFSSRRINENVFFRLFIFLMFTALAIRIGFADFAIMSGRLSTAFSYVEIFALPMLLLDRFKLRARIVLVLVVCLLQMIVTLGFQAPYLFELYFEPLYTY